MSTHRELEVVEAEARYCRERVALLRARLYSRGMGSTPRLLELERQLQRAEQRLAGARSPSDLSRRDRWAT
jgi:hypothetical protein